MKSKREIYVVMSAVLVLAGFTGCSMFQNSRATTFSGNGGFELSQGKSALLAGDKAGAQRHLQNAASQGNSAEAHYYLALLNHGKDRDAAIRHIQDSLQIHPSAQGFLLKGALFNRRQPEKALQSYQMGLQRAEPGSKLSGLLHRNAGLALAQQGRWEKARPHVQKYVEIAGQRGQTLSDDDLALWGLCFYQAGQEEKAHQTWSHIRNRRIYDSIESAIREGNLQVTQFE